MQQSTSFTFFPADARRDSRRDVSSDSRTAGKYPAYRFVLRKQLTPGQWRVLENAVQNSHQFRANFVKALQPLTASRNDQAVPTTFVVSAEIAQNAYCIDLLW